MSTVAPESATPWAEPANRAIAVRLEGLRKVYGDVVAVDGIDLEVMTGEFFSFLGPSGSGKTTTLRMIAGFEPPTAGRIQLSGRDVSRLPPYERDVNTVFQDYALFPHMDVAQNVGYGLMIAGMPNRDRRDRVAEALRMVQLEGYDHRRPGQLSGGQRQRVALARAIINRPTVLLLDEPLGALDLKLRQQMQLELKQIQGRVGITFIYVTHDQDEALTMSDRLAVFDRGRIEQVGTPAEVYERPHNSFVAGFVGISNVIAGEAARSVTGQAGVYSVRPEKIHLADPVRSPADDEVAVDGRIAEVAYLGPETRYIVALDVGGELVVVEQNLATSSSEALAAQGRAVRLIWKRQHSRPLTDEVERAQAGGSDGP